MEALAGLWFIVIGLGVTVPIALIIGVGMIFCWFGIKKARKKSRELKEAPLVTIDELGTGLYKIKGKIRGQEEPLRSPLARKKCVYFRFHVEELRSRSSRINGQTHHSSTWVTIVDDRQWTDLTIVDKSGEIEIDLAVADVTLTTKAFTQSGTFDGASERLESLMRNRYGKSTKGWIFNKSMRYTESYLCDGDKVLVVGDVEIPRGESPEFYKGDHNLLVTDMKESEVANLYTGHMIAYWVGLGVLAALLLLVCGGGGVFSVVSAVMAGKAGHLMNRPAQVQQPPPKDPPANAGARPKPIPPEWDEKKMSLQFLCDMPEQNVKLAWGKFGKNGTLGYADGFGQPDVAITIANKPYPKSISFHPPDDGESVVQYRLNRQFKLFKATTAINDLPAGAKGSATPLTFQVFGDGELLWASDPPIQTTNNRQLIHISVENVEMLELRVRCPGKRHHAWAVWINACVLRDGKF